MQIKDLIPSEEIKDKKAPLNKDVDSCISNYEQANSRSLLFLLPGVNYDTYKLIPKFLKKAPCAIVTENKSKFPKTKINIIEVKNARRSYAYAKSRMAGIDYSSIKFIGITGTNGKTSSATMIRRILEYDGRKCGFIGTGKIEYADKSLADKYYSMTCPDPDILYPSIKEMQDAGCEYIIMEVSSHALELDKTAPINFDIGIFTGISHEHLEFHGSMENYFAAKEKLIANSRSAIINYDDPKGKELYEKYEEKSIGIGILSKANRGAIGIENHGIDGIKYIFRGKNFLTKIELPLPGFYNVYNSSFAFECAYLLGVSPKRVKAALESMGAIEGRFECIKGKITVIIDYAHTPKALENIFKTIICSKKSRQKITLVFGCGGERDTEKRPMMAAVAEKYADKIIITNDNPRKEPEEKIIFDIIRGFKNKSYAVITDRVAAITYAITSSRDSEIVIIAGKGHEKYILDNEGYHDFDERETIKNALKLRK